MKRIYSFLLFLVSFSCSVYAIDDIGVPYVGFNAQVREMDFRRGYGKHMFAKTVPQGELYAGLKINPYVGFELGYLRSEERHKSNTLKYPDHLLGTPVSLTPGDYERGNTSFKIEGGSVNVVGFLPISEDFQLLGTLGLARLRVKLRYIPLNFSGHDLTSQEIASHTRDFTSSKYVPQAKVGIQYMMTQALGLKALVGWDGTSRFNLLTNKQASPARASLKDSYTAGLGLAYYFN